jgi:hypothetical protein
VLVEKIDQVFEAALTAASKPARKRHVAARKIKSSGKPLKKK